MTKKILSQENIEVDDLKMLSIVSALDNIFIGADVEGIDLILSEITNINALIAVRIYRDIKEDGIFEVISVFDKATSDCGAIFCGKLNAEEVLELLEFDREKHGKFVHIDPTDDKDDFYVIDLDKVLREYIELIFGVTTN